MTQRDPGRLIQIGMGFWPAKTLLSAVELDLFTVLSDKALTARQLQNALELIRAASSTSSTRSWLWMCWRETARARPQNTAIRRMPLTFLTATAAPISAVFFDRSKHRLIHACM